MNNQLERKNITELTKLVSDNIPLFQGLNDRIALIKFIVNADYLIRTVNKKQIIRRCVDSSSTHECSKLQRFSKNVVAILYVKKQ